MEKSFPLPASAPHSWQGRSRCPGSCSLPSPPGAAQVTWSRGSPRCHGTGLWWHGPGTAQRHQCWSLMPAAQEGVSLQIWLGGLRVCCAFGSRLLGLSLDRWQIPEPEVLQMRNTLLPIWRGLVYLTCGHLNGHWCTCSAKYRISFPVPQR